MRVHRCPVWCRRPGRLHAEHPPRLPPAAGPARLLPLLPHPPAPTPPDTCMLCHAPHATGEWLPSFGDGCKLSILALSVRLSVWPYGCTMQNKASPTATAQHRTRPRRCRGSCRRPARASRSRGPRRPASAPPAPPLSAAPGPPAARAARLQQHDVSQVEWTSPESEHRDVHIITRSEADSYQSRDA